MQPVVCVVASFGTVQILRNMQMRFNKIHISVFSVIALFRYCINSIMTKNSRILNGKACILFTARLIFHRSAVEVCDVITLLVTLGDAMQFVDRYRKICVSFKRLTVTGSKME